MPANTLLTSTPVVRLSEDVEDRIYNFRPTDTPLVSSIERVKVEATFHEWTADTYRAANAGNAAVEGADASFVTPSQPGVFGNRTQIFQDTVSVSGTTEAVKKYGRKSEVKRLKAKKALELRKDIEAAVIASGTSVTATGAVAGRLRGLYGFVATNNSLGATGVAPNPGSNVAPTAGTLRPFAEADLKTVIRATYEQGGDGDVLMVSPQHKVAASGFNGNVTRMNEVGDKKTAQTKLQAAFSIYGHDFGETKIVPNRVMTTASGGGGAGLVNTAYLLDYDKIKLGQLRTMQTSELAKVGDSEQWQMLTELTLVVGQESTLGAIRDLTPTGL